MQLQCLVNKKIGLSHSGFQTSTVDEVKTSKNRYETTESTSLNPSNT